MNLFYLYLCYFTFGWCLSFIGIATQFTMIDRLKLSPVEMTMAYGIISSPWCIKPLYGFISDRYIVFDWGRRRPYISVVGYLATCLYVFIPYFINSKTGFVLTLTTISGLICFSDVCADSITVELVKKEETKGATQTACWTARAIGTLTGSLFSGVVYSSVGAIDVFRLSAIFPFLMSILIWRLPINNKELKTPVLDTFIDNLKDQKQLALVFLLISIAPDYGDIYTYYLKSELGYKPSDFAWMSVSGSTSFLLATLTFNKFLLKKPFGIIIMVGIIGRTIFQCTQLLVVTGIFPYFWVVLCDGVAESFFQQLILMPLIIKAAEGCKDGVEGSIYAFLMSVCNFSDIVGTWFGGMLGSLLGVTQFHFDNILWLIVICVILNLVIPFVVILKTFSASPEEESFSDMPLDHTLEPEDPELLVSTVETSEIREENKRAMSANKVDFWGYRSPLWRKWGRMQDHSDLQRMQVK